MITFNNVAMRYGAGPPALDRVTFTVARGEFCVLLGPSGAGKSTLLRTVNGLTTPTAGEVKLDGVKVDVASLRRLRPTIGMIHQQFNLTQRASVATNVIAGALPAVSTLRALFGLFPQHYRRKTCELLAEVGLAPEHLRRRVSELSGGQQQRVGIARAFMLDPAVVLADEPVASLDPRTSRDVLELLKKEAIARHATVICSLHQIDLARDFADRIVALKAGRVAFDGAPGALTPEILADIYESTPVAEPAPETRARLMPGEAA